MASAPDTLAPAAESVTVRMYRGILGDCFLLTHRLGTRTYRALIDCGVLQCIGAAGTKEATRAGTRRIRDIVADLKDHTGGVLDLVVATHEHYDHLSGFILAHDLFKDFTFRRLWTAWTEDRTDSLANDIRAKRCKGLEVLAGLVKAGDDGTLGAIMPLDGDGSTDSGDADQARKLVAGRVGNIANLLQFYGEIDPWRPGPAMAAGARRSFDPARDKPRSCEHVLLWLAHKAGEGNCQRLDPGMQVRFGIDDRLVANVLGPPRLRSRLLKMDPTKGASEVYLDQVDDGVGLASTLTFQAAAAAATGLDQLPAEELPFARRFWRSDAEVRAQAEAEAAAGAEERQEQVHNLYYEGKAERRIDGEWTASAEAMALKIDGDVNNTSLALAIEVTGGDVLLFPADAQVGNWLSWHDQKYPAKPDSPEARQKSAKDLLERVILYKVGHHGSHNATARDQGLELMTHPELAAMIPVVEAVAGEQTTSSNPDGWEMPYDPLFARLKEKTGGRILKGDGDPRKERTAFAKSRFEVAYGPQPKRLWVELTRNL